MCNVRYLLRLMLTSFTKPATQPTHRQHEGQLSAVGGRKRVLCITQLHGQGKEDGSNETLHWEL